MLLARSALCVAFVCAAAAPVALLAPPVLAQDAQTPQETEAAPAGENWAGSIELPNGMELEIKVVFTETDAGHAAAIDIPMQGAFDLALSDVSYGDEISFAIQQAGAVFNGTRDGDDAIKGTMMQAGMEMPFTLKRSDGAPALVRPQHPSPPYPYEVREVTYRNDAADVTLAGTFTVPAGAGPHPAVVLITGSGPQDRDETIFGHKPFLVIADHLTRKGIAVLRADDRGFGESTGDFSTATTLDFASDARSGLDYLKTLSEIDSSHLGVVGHSEGGLIAPFLAAESDDLSFIVLLAGTGIPGGEILSLQLRTIMEASGATDVMIDQMIEQQQSVFKLIASEPSERELRLAVSALVTAQANTADPEVIEAQVEQQMAAVNSRWFRTFIDLDPRPALRQVRCPVLVMNGSLDFQVPPEANLPEIRKALEAAPTSDFEIVEFPGLNHMFQTAETGLLDEYGRIEETFAPAALNTMSTWIAARVATPGS